MLEAALPSFAFVGVFGGYFSSHSYKIMGGRQWMRNTVLTASFMPLVLLLLYFLLSCIFWAERSSAGPGAYVWFALLGKHSFYRRIRILLKNSHTY